MCLLCQQWVAGRGRHTTSRALFGPHFVDTRLVYLTCASGTLNDLPTHDKATTEVRILRLEWVARLATTLPRK